MNCNGPGINRPRQWIAISINDVAALRDQRSEPLLAAGMVAERGKVENSKRDDRDDPGINEHAEHQPLVHDREQLAALADESEPLGPWRDESGRRCVHLSAVSSLELPECLAGSGASGSSFASLTVFVTGLTNATAGLSTDFLVATETALATGFLTEGWAAARPGFSADSFFAGFAAAAGLSVELAVVWGNATTNRAGTSRVSVFRLAS